MQVHSGFLLFPESYALLRRGGRRSVPIGTEESGMLKKWRAAWEKYPGRMSACMLLFVFCAPLLLVFLTMLPGIGKPHVELIWDVCSIIACLLTFRGVTIRCQEERPDEWRWFLVAFAALVLIALFVWDGWRMLRILNNT